MPKLGRQERYEKRSLAMAARAKDWEQIERAHDPQGHKAIDHSHHMEAYKANEHYTNMLSEESEYPTQSVEGIGAGKSTKLIHDVPISEDDPSLVQRTMTKPYHSTIPSTTRTWIKNPIRGWATMATKSLYNAAGISELAEDVTVHEHKGTPVTVHNFAKGFDTVYDLYDQVARQDSPIQRYPNPLHVYQIAVMDFLTGNIDRHGYNLMMSNNQTEDGHHPLLAIDHENSFQYNKSLAEISGTDDKHMPERNIAGRKSDKPYDYMHLSTGLHQAHRAGYDNGWEDFHEWWAEHADAIKTEFENQISHISNEQIRDHVQRNFELRFNIIQRWAGDEDESNHQEIDLFSRDFPYEAKNTSMQLAEPEMVDSIAGALPSDPVKAILMIGEVFEGRGISVKQKLLATYNRLLDNLDPEQIVNLYDKAMKDSKKKIEHVPLSISILFHILKHGDEAQADALLAYENQGKPGKIPLALKNKLREV